MKNLNKNIFIFVVCLVFCFCCCACCLCASGIQVLKADDTAPFIKDIKALDSKTIELTFSKSADIKDIIIIKKSPLINEETLCDFLDTLPEDAKSIEVQDIKQNDATVLCHLKDATNIGQQYILYAHLQDKGKNTQTVVLPFCAFNDRQACLLISEVRNEYSSNKQNPQKTKAEFIEFYVTKSGNTAGLQVFSADDSKKDVAYTFPAIEVKKGEYITLHYRLIAGLENLCIDETGGDLSLCNLPEANNKARDLWNKNTGAVFGKTQDVIVIKDLNTGDIKDALLYATSDVTQWKNQTLEALAKQAFCCGAWQGGATVDFAANATGATATRTLTRQSYTTPSKKQDWIVTKTSGNTPGAKNSTQAYTAK